MVDDAAEFPRADDARPREAKKNQPHYLGDKVDAAVERMEEQGDPLPDAAQDVIEENEAALHDLVDAEE